MKNKKQKYFFIRLLVAAGLIGTLFFFIHPIDLWIVMKSADLVLLVYAFFITILSFLIRTVRLNILLKDQNLKFSYGQLVNIGWISLFAGNFLPSTFGADAAKTYQLFKKSQKIFIPATIVLVERFIGLLALLLIGFFSTIFFRPEGVTLPLVFLLGIGVFVLLIGFKLVSKPNILSRVPLWKNRFVKRDKFQEKLSMLSALLADYEKKWKLSLTVIFLSLAAQFLSIFVYVLCGFAVGVNISVSYYLSIIPLVSLVSMIPVSLNGLGIKEGGIIFFLGLAGISINQSVGLAVLARLIMVSMSLGGAILYFMEPMIRTTSADSVTAK